MKVIVCDNYASQCAAGADIIEKIFREKPDCCLGLATGSSPIGMYQELSRRCKEEGLDFSKVSTVNLDEYIGLEPTHDQSYRYFMDSNLFDHINIDKANTYVARFFASRDEVPRYAVTMGIGEIMMAKRLLMILSGANKEEAARLLLMSDDVTCACPATLMKLHHDATVLITRELADKIGYQG